MNRLACSRAFVLILATVASTAAAEPSAEPLPLEGQLARARRAWLEHAPQDARRAVSERATRARALWKDREDAVRRLHANRGRGSAALSALAPSAVARNVAVSDPAQDDPGQNDAQSQPSIAAWGTNVLAVWNDGTQSAEHLVGFAYSTNGGQSFVDGGTPPDPFVPGGLWTSDPVITVNERTGEFYFCALVDPDVPNIEEHGVGVLRGVFSGNSFVWTRLRVVKSLQDLGEGDLIDQPWVTVDSLSGNVYLTYTRYTATSDSIIFLRSLDRGETWGPQLALSNPIALPVASNSRPAVGPDGEVYVIWREKSALPPSGRDFIRIRKSTNFGVSFAPVQTVAQYFDNWGSGAPGYNTEAGVTRPSIVVDRNNTSFHRGRVYVAWNETVNFYDATLAPTTPRPEVEPNDTTFTATPFTIGETLTGAFGRAAEFDYYSFAAVQGTTYLFFCDQHALQYTMRVYCSDGVTRLAFSGDRLHSPPLDGLIVWTCPASGTYYFRMAEFEGGTGNYRVLTAVDPPGGPSERARDQRDVFVTASDDGTTWTTPKLVNGEPPGFDDWLPEVAVDGNGTAYVMWLDWHDDVTSCGGQSQTYLSKSLDGGLNWLPVGVLTSQATAWTSVNSNTFRNQGEHTALFANTLGVFPAWTDGRNGTPDIESARFLLSGIEVLNESTVLDLGAVDYPNDQVELTWRSAGPPPANVDLYRALGTGAFAPIATNLTFSGNRLDYADTQLVPGNIHRYRLRMVITGTPMFQGDGQVDVPRPPASSINRVFPNPSVHNLRVEFALPDDQPAKLSLFDLTGRMLREVQVRGVGTHQFDFWPEFQLDAGIYFLKLSHNGNVSTQRVAIVP